MYSNALKTFFYPVLNRLANCCLPPSDEQFLNGHHIEGLLLLLQYNPQNGTSLSMFLENLCRELESFLLEVNKQFAFQEMEVNCLKTLINSKRRGKIQPLLVTCGS